MNKVRVNHIILSTKYHKHYGGINDSRMLVDLNKIHRAQYE